MFEIFENNFGRKDVAVVTSAVDADEVAVEFTLAKIDFPHVFLELDAGFVDVALAFEIVAVTAAAAVLELPVHECDRNVEEYVTVRLGNA